MGFVRDVRNERERERWGGGGGSFSVLPFLWDEVTLEFRAQADY